MLRKNRYKNNVFLGKINDELIFKSVMNYWEKIFDIVVVL